MKKALCSIALAVAFIGSSAWALPTCNTDSWRQCKSISLSSGSGVIAKNTVTACTPGTFDHYRGVGFSDCTLLNAAGQPETKEEIAAETALTGEFKGYRNGNNESGSGAPHLCRGRVHACFNNGYTDWDGTDAIACKSACNTGSKNTACTISICEAACDALSSDDASLCP